MFCVLLYYTRYCVTTRLNRFIWRYTKFANFASQIICHDCQWSEVFFFSMHHKLYFTRQNIKAFLNVWEAVAKSASKGIYIKHWRFVNSEVSFQLNEVIILILVKWFVKLPKPKDMKFYLVLAIMSTVVSTVSCWGESVDDFSEGKL